MESVSANLVSSWMSEASIVSAVRVMEGGLMRGVSGRTKGRMDGGVFTCHW